MNLINTFILWIWVLGISLLIPISLPAGGLQKLIIEKRENSASSPLIAYKNFDLLSSARDNSSILARVKVGTPIQVLKVWESSDRSKWLLVSVLNDSSRYLTYKRGWVNLGTSS